MAVRNKKKSKPVANQVNNNVLTSYADRKKPGFFKSTGDQLLAIPKFEADQQQVLKHLTSLLGGGINNLPLPGQNRESFAPYKQEAQRRFKQETIPSIAERFQSLGGAGTEGGALSSPALYGHLAGAGANLDSQLAALEAQYGQQQQGIESGNLFNLLQAGLMQRNDTGTIPGQNSGIRNIWNGVKGAVPGLVAGGLTGGASGALYGGLNGLGLGQVGDALQQRQQSNVSGFTPQQSNGFGYSQPLGIGGINSSIANGYGQNNMPSSNQYLFPTQF